MAKIIGVKFNTNTIAVTGTTETRASKIFFNNIFFNG